MFDGIGFNLSMFRKNDSQAPSLEERISEQRGKIERLEHVFRDIDEEEIRKLNRKFSPAYTKLVNNTKDKRLELKEFRKDLHYTLTHELKWPPVLSSVISVFAYQAESRNLRKEERTANTEKKTTLKNYRKELEGILTDSMMWPKYASKAVARLAVPPVTSEHANVGDFIIGGYAGGSTPAMFAKPLETIENVHAGYLEGVNLPWDIGLYAISIASATGLLNMPTIPFLSGTAEVASVIVGVILGANVAIKTVTLPMRIAKYNKRIYDEGIAGGKEIKEDRNGNRYYRGRSGVTKFLGYKKRIFVDDLNDVPQDRIRTDRHNNRYYRKHEHMGQVASVFSVNPLEMLYYTVLFGHDIKKKAELRLANRKLSALEREYQVQAPQSYPDIGIGRLIDQYKS